MNVQRLLTGGRLVIGATTMILAAGCASPTSPDASSSSTGSNRARPEVMDLSNTPPVAPPPPSAPVAPTPPPVAEAPAAPRKHVVAAKETLYSLAVKYYGDGKQWTKIRDANPGLVPEHMPVGKSIVIP